MGRNSVSFSESSLEVLVHVLQAGGVFELGLLLGDRVFLALEQFLGRVAPRAEVVLVEDDEIPLHLVQPLVLGLDVARRRRGPADPGTSRSRRAASWRTFGRVAAGVAREVLPAVEVGVGLEVRLPGILHGGLERDHEHPLGAELLGELIGGEGLAEAHLRVPQETRDGVHVLLPDRVEVGVGLVHGLGLLRAHRERLVVRAGELLPVRSSVSTVFTSSSVQRIHSSSAFAKPFLTRRRAPRGR